MANQNCSVCKQVVSGWQKVSFTIYVYYLNIVSNKQNYNKTETAGWNPLCLLNQTESMKTVKCINAILGMGKKGKVKLAINDFTYVLW